MSNDTTVQERAVYQDLRERLIDLSRRNRLLNFRHSSRASLVRIVDEVPERVLSQLCDDVRFRFRALPAPDIEPEDERTPEFQAAVQRGRLDEAFIAEMAKIDPDDASAAATEARLERDLRDRIRARLKLPRRPQQRDIDPARHARANGITPDFDLPPASGPLLSKHTDNYLQTLLFPDQLKTKIGKIYRNTRDIEGETGVNTLHLAIGFLEWFESDSSDEALLSPLLLLPTGLERTTTRGGEDEYRLAALDSTPSTNLSLELRLREDSLRFPKFDSDADSPVEDYLHSIQDMIKTRPRWHVRRYLTLASFSFARIAMYHDLDPLNWASVGSPAAHPLVRPILRGTSTDPNAGIGKFATEYDIDQPAIEQIAPMLVHDADSSQHSAIIDAMQGRSFVIEGPPGTGKSQTIANLIAAAIHRGKTVLFVSEKMAALEVVKSRLDRVDLGDYCLTLHSAGAKPATVIDALKRRAARRAPRPLVGGQGEAHIASGKSEIGKHLTALHAAIGPDGETAHALIGRYTGIQRTMPDLRFNFRTHSTHIPREIGSELVAAARRHLQALEDAAWPRNRPNWNPAGSPFKVLTRADLLPDEQDEFLQSLETILMHCQALKELHGSLAHQFKMVQPDTLQALRANCALIDSLSDPPPMVDRALLARSATRQDTINLLEFAGVAETVADAGARLAQAGIQDPVAADPKKLGAVGHLAEALGLHRETVADLPAIVSNMASLNDHFEQHDRTVDSLIAILELDRATLYTLGYARRAAELAADADPSWHAHRRTALHCHAAHLTQTAERQDQWLPLIRALDSKLAVLNMTPAAARHLAATLQNAGWFGVLRGEVRDARKRFAACWRGGPMPRGKSKAAHLEAAAALLDERDALATDTTVTTALGGSFDPFTTPLRALAATATWQLRVSETLSGDTLEVTQVRVALLSMGSDRLNRLASLAEPARAAVQIPGQHGFSDDAPWKDVKRNIAVRAAGMVDLMKAVAALGLSNTVRLNDLTQLAAVAQQWQEGTARLSSDQARALLGAEAPEAASLLGAAAFATAVHRDMPFVAEHLLGDGWDATITAFRNTSAQISAEIARADEQLQRLAELGLAPFVSRAPGLPLDSLVSAARDLVAAKADLAPYLRFATTRTHCIDNPLSNAVVLAYDASGSALRQLPAALDWLVAWTLVRRAADADRRVFTRAGAQLDTLRANFANADRTNLRTAAELVAAAAHRRVVPGGSAYGSRKQWTDGSLLQNEFGKQRRHIPLRDLMGRAGAAITALAPCVMMSPLTVAQYLPPGKLEFDFVVMDEASQIKPEDAIGALLRGRQTIIVGDSKQLPPTNFFDRALDDDAEEDEEDGGPVSAADKVMAESVLDLAARSFQPARRLRWHYRSQHESLIAFSNREFYDDDLIVFPASQPPSATLGIELVQVDGIWRNRTNVEEAQALARAVTAFMRDYPSLSHGVVAMNQPQRELIQAEIDVLAANDQILVKYKARWEERLEPPFVKNLENVQGDERDVIFISLGWGKTPEGAIHQRFFPINRKEDGHRRLNVLLTRAKRKLVLFSSLQPESIVVDPLNGARGVRVLRDYLLYARDGRLDPGKPAGAEPDSPFEAAVAEALRARGHSVELQVGVAGYFIDMAVRHPEMADRFVLGIECDGAAYHSAKSARDRDRLRQEALERLGWHLIRVWSTDWFRNPDAEADRLSAEISSAVAASQETEAAGSRLVAQLSKPDFEIGDDEHPAADKPFQLTPPNDFTTARMRRPVIGSPSAPLFTYEDMATKLRRFRDDVILAEFPGSEPGRCLLRDEMIEVIVRERLDDPDDFAARIPQWLRTRTDGRQMKFLERICDLVGQDRPPPGRAWH